jgi:myo-inositol 2-dehydrogenase/D-chiro-inositol 1-dehydrogenase
MSVEPMDQGAEQPTVRVGVIGAGAMGAAHIRTLADWVPAAKVTAVFDADTARAKSVASEVSARVADSADAVISGNDVDAVLIAAPDSLHEELALACVGAQLPTLCEKPLTTTADGARRVVDAEVAVGRRLIQVGFMRRFDPAFTALRDLVLDGAVGDIRVAHCVHRNAQAHPSATSDGIVVNSMIHELDSVPWLLDDTLAAITVVAPRVPDGALRDPQIALLETAGGVLITVEVFVNAGYGYDIHCEIVGTSGTASLGPPYGLTRRRLGGDGREVASDFVARFADAYRIELHAWIESVQGGGATAPSAWDGYLANRAAEAGVESLNTRQRVEIAQTPTPDLYL